MAWCPHCSGHHPTSESPNGFSSCSSCGRILSHLHTSQIHTIAAALNLDDLFRVQPIIFSFAHKLFTLAQSNPLLHPITPEIKSQIAAVCLYIALHRHNSKPSIMLLHLSHHLNTTHYSLAAILLLLCKTFKIKHLDRFTDHDPSLFMHRFSTCLRGRADSDVATTALRIIAEFFKLRDGSNPELIPISGICNAALYLAASAHGHVFSELEVVGAVSVEFKRMKSTSHELTMEEFVSRAGRRSKNGHRLKKKSSVCGHEGNGLCQQCYEVFVKMSGVGRSLNKKKRRRSKEEDCAADDVDMYINSEKVRQYRSLIWEEMNREYMEEQLAKKIARASERKEKKQRGNNGVGRGTRKKVEEKKLSSRVNYDVLSKLIGEEGKRSEMDHTGVNDEEERNSGDKEEVPEEFVEETEGHYDDDQEEVYEDFDGGGEGHGEGGYNDYLYDGNEDYGDDDFGF